MADLTFFQKYPKADEDQSGPKSIRADHPNFGNVLRCIYAKGVITDFEKVADDPIEVKSRVKVRIGDEEYDDFIPLFFNPKAQYWDDPGIPPSPYAATDFNSEGKYFEKAWMSFRCGDEVAVLMQATVEDDELMPAAVIGFADGVPRIGESVVKVVYETIEYQYRRLYWSGNHPYDYPDDWWISTDEDIYHAPGEHFRYFDMLSSPDDPWTAPFYGDLDEDKDGPDDVPMSLLKEIEPCINDVDSSVTNESGTGTSVCPCGGVLFRSNPQNYSSNCTEKTCYTRFVFSVGPILFMVEMLWIHSDYYCEFSLDHPCSGGCPMNYRIDKKVSVIESVKNALYTPEIYLQATTQNTMTPLERYDAYWETGNWQEEIEGVNIDDKMTVVFGAIYQGTSSVPNNQYDPSKYRIYIRPHTKEELIEANMWPKEE